MEKVVQFILGFLALAATATQEEIVARANLFTEQLRAAGIVAKEGTVLTAQTVMEHITGAFTELKTLKANYALVAKALDGQPTDTPEKFVALITSLKDKSGYVLKSEFDALQLKFTEREVDELIATAMLKGKITPAEKDAYRALALKDRSTFTTLITAKADYSAVPLQLIQTADTVVAAKGVTDVDLAVAKQLNVSKDALTKVSAN